MRDSRGYGWLPLHQLRRTSHPVSALYSFFTASRCRVALAPLASPESAAEKSSARAPRPERAAVASRWAASRTAKVRRRAVRSRATSSNIPDATE